MIDNIDKWCPIKVSRAKKGIYFTRVFRSSSPLDPLEQTALLRHLFLGIFFQVFLSFSQIPQELIY
ncbi:hypothetical protein PJP07_30560, partial [Mycobacterium kansasii]